MQDIVNLVMICLAVATAIPTLFLVLQIVAALPPARLPTRTEPTLSPRVAVVVPAHNEEAIIAKTVGSILATASRRRAVACRRRQLHGRHGSRGLACRRRSGLP